MKKMGLLPSVKHIAWGSGVFTPGLGMQIRCPGPASKIGERVRGILGSRLPLVHDERLRDEIIIGNIPFRKHVKLPNAEAYHIVVADSGIILRGASERALFYAAVTLGQLAGDSREIREVEIRDWPDLPMRAYHLDLKGAVPTFGYLKGFIEELGKFKVNTLVIEYEDMFPFVKYADLSSPNAFSPGELSSLMKITRDNYIDTVPLLQSHGHVEYIVSKPAYRELAEPASIYSEFCPCNPKSIKLYASLVEEIFKYHGGSRYFHVGGDEAYSMGSCPKCREVVRKKGHLGLFIDHMNRVFDIVMAYKMTPIFWDDMLWMYGDLKTIKKLRKGVVACYWDYLNTTEKNLRFVWNRGWYTSRKWCSKDLSVFDDMRHWRNLELKWIEDARGDAIRFAKRYWKSNKDYTSGDSFARIDFLTDHGIDVIGASVAKGGASNFAGFYPLFHRQSDNIRIWSRIAKEKKILGVINTGWSRSVSTSVPFEPLDMSWYLIVLGAQCYWDARELSREDFDKMFNRVFLQTQDEAYTFAIRAIDVGEPLEMAHERLEGLSVDKKRQVIVSHMALAVEFAQTIHIAEKRMSLAKHESYLYNKKTYHPAWVKSRMDDLRKSRAELISLSSRMKSILAMSLKSDDVREYIDTHITHRIKEIEYLLNSF
jgi:hexosaminidase